MAYNSKNNIVGDLDLEEIDPIEELKLSGKYILTFGSPANPSRKEVR